MSGFTIVNNSIFNDNNLNSQEKFLLIVLKTFDHKRDGVVYPSYEKLMKSSGIARRNNISKIIKSLQDKKYLIISKRGRVNTYTFIKDYLISDKVNINIDTNEEKNSNDSDTNKDYNNNQISTYDDTDEKENSTTIDINKSNNSNQRVIIKNRTSIQLATDTSNQLDTRSSNQLDTSNQLDIRSSNQSDTNTRNPLDTSISNTVDTLKIKEKNTKEKYIIYNDLNDNYIFNKSRISINSC